MSANVWTKEVSNVAIIKALVTCFAWGFYWRSRVRVQYVYFSNLCIIFRAYVSPHSQPY